METLCPNWSMINKWLNFGKSLQGFTTFYQESILMENDEKWCNFRGQQNTSWDVSVRHLTDLFSLLILLILSGKLTKNQKREAHCRCNNGSWHPWLKPGQKYGNNSQCVGDWQRPPVPNNSTHSQVIVYRPGSWWLLLYEHVERALLIIQFSKLIKENSHLSDSAETRLS